ncbi:TIGR01440 family protein [Peribacillus kribbensis]|uniref:TIGR01440 family protein n=1 Tax=Peribacillus kribbensis TaxID=356658 RepID=UPI000406A331|nr:TIGR01440 family protein [Peribacillus kribbensis]
MEERSITKQDLELWQSQLKEALEDFQKQASLTAGKLMVVGCSTSEVVGRRIGTAGTHEVAEMLFGVLRQFHEDTGVELAFQCCEHLNRALVLTNETAAARGYEEVTVIPIRQAGGALATFAFNSLEDPVVVEHIKADAGIDIGDTFIGMHLKHVAVPIRTIQKQIGHAHLTTAKTRPKLIGGERACYT